MEQALADPAAIPAELPGGLIRLAAGRLLIAFLGLCLLAALVVGVVLLVRFVF